MRKFSSAEPEQAIRRPNMLRRLLLLVVLLVISPVMIEIALVHVGKWQRIMGVAPLKVKTRVTNIYGNSIGDTKRSVENTLSHYLNNTPWRASNVFVIGSVLAAAGTLMLRKKT